ncbi:Na+/H+ antiporter subunit E [Haliovirga abyssi]|uniref:Na+/H+ antiporter subunit E n=1 Tax=Haliovirga abyssi TaxID=2996794 RepID=A0AAU9DZ25_9FUSO|nr:Na+/H+ antiporter subunit E [Haliovirga abyssi]BDU50735.1 Na+/H+ antiporter subunit E [Haliovirga abyssi]
MKKFISTFVLLWLIWIVATGISIQEIVVGGIASLIVAAVIYKQVSYSFGVDSIVKIFKFVFVYIPVFIYQMILSNLDVAYRVLSPSLPINPGFVKIKTSLKGEVGKLALANSITLTPGTLTLDVDDENIYIHWIDVKGSGSKEYQENISQTFEKVLGGIFE